MNSLGIAEMYKFLRKDDNVPSKNEISQISQINKTDDNIAEIYRIKCLFAGESSVGKSSLVHLLKHECHNPSLEPTIGMYFAVLDVKLDEYPGQTVKTQLWDSSGSSRFRNIVQSYMRDLDIVFLVFDMNNRSSWDALRGWKEEIDKFRKYDKIPLFVIVGTKSDLHQYQVDFDEISQMCREWNAKSYIVSCVETSSHSIIKRMLYKSVYEYHKNLLNMESEKLPEHVRKNFSNKMKLDLDVEPQQKFCCFQ